MQTPRLFSLSLRIFLTVLTIGVLAASLVPAAQAATPTPKATAVPLATPQPSPSATTQKLKERIEKVIEQRRDQVEGVINQLGDQRRGFIGEVQRVTEKTVTVRTNKGTQILTIENGVSLLRDNRKITVDDIAVGDWVLVLGKMDQDNFVPKRVLVSSTSLRPRKYDTTVGTLRTIRRTQLTFLSQATKENVVVNITKTTKIQDSQGNPLEQKDLKTDTQYVVIWATENNVQNAFVIRSLAPTQ